MNALWTKTLIPNIADWIYRNHGEVGYHLTQFLSGHGCFQPYLERFKITENHACLSCGDFDTSQHAIFECSRWKAARMMVNLNMGRNISPANIVSIMIVYLEVSLLW